MGLREAIKENGIKQSWIANELGISTSYLSLILNRKRRLTKKMEADLANNTITQQISFSIREKEMTKLRRIDAALGRIEEGVFGLCIESGEEIELKRLETQPWAEFCIEVAEEREREFNKRFHKRA